MKRFFLYVYDYFSKRPAVCYTLMSVTFFALLYIAVQVKFEEDITRFFPDRRESQNTEMVFRNLRIKDKIIVMFSHSNPEQSPDELIEAGEKFRKSLLLNTGEEYIQNIFFEVNEELMEEAISFIYDHLPIFLTEEDYIRLDSLMLPGAIENRVKSNFRTLLSPLGTGLKNVVLKDPLGIGINALKSLQELQLSANYNLYNSHVFSEDMSTLLMVVTPTHGTGRTGKNESLIEAIEEQINESQAIARDVNIEYFGGPSVSVYNARQIKKDTTLTLTIALLIIVVFITGIFKSRSAVLLIILPVLYGAVFSLALISLIKGSVSAIAIGAGAAVFGVALSYSIHVVSHFNHVTSVRQLIDELAYPMTVGSFTTVGAFLGLLFTSSEILRDFGLFSSLALIGTTFFSLVFLPHLLKSKKKHTESGRVLRLIEKINSYPYEKNKYLVGSLIMLFIICLFLSNKVTFDSNMSNLSFEPKHIKAAEKKLENLFNTDNRTILFVSVGTNEEEGLNSYIETNRQLAALQEKELIKEYASAEKILVPVNIQQERIDRWNRYWTKERKEIVRKEIDQAAGKYGFRENAFTSFYSLLEKNYTTDSFISKNSAFKETLNDWATVDDNNAMFITQVRIPDEYKEEVYNYLASNDQLVIFDRAWFAGKWVTAINADFYLILYICSFLIFFALLISYGRIELTLMTFAPMAISWVIILGIMAITGVQFNIVNIILATFIFGLGDDFSIFIMDGLQQEYRTGKKLLASHKTAIFFSSFTAVVGLGALAFAKHPALQSISVISFLGMISVVLVSYTVLPILFRTFISRPASRGNYPYTFKSILVTIWFYNAFVVGCSLAAGVASILLILPVTTRKKKEWFSITITYMLRGFLKTAWIAKNEVINPHGETFHKPAVIVANHQSFIDILIMLSLAPKMVMVTNNWVWNSPFFGRIVRYADFVQTGEGYEIVLNRLKKKTEAGYLVVIFPEGTRSADLQVHRFHKGAFYIAEQLQLDILPVVLYGTGMVISKRQPFYVKKGILATTILPRIRPDDVTYGCTYQERSKAVCSLVRKTYKKTCEHYANPSNPWFYQKLIANYIYKGPVEEWYIRVKVKMEHCYSLFNNLIPRNAIVTDIGCGFGSLDYMLMLFSGEREITGIDYDEDKIALASNNFARNKQINFQFANAVQYEIQISNIFILNDVLHYMDRATQKQLLYNCIDKLTPEGIIIIRDGDCSNRKYHRITRFTEFISTRLTGFNKRENDLYFPSGEFFEQIAAEYNMSIERRANDNYTSNTIFILRKEQDR